MIEQNKNPDLNGKNVSKNYFFIMGTSCNNEYPKKLIETGNFLKLKINCFQAQLFTKKLNNDLFLMK